MDQEDERLEELRQGVADAKTRSALHLATEKLATYMESLKQATH